MNDPTEQAKLEQAFRGLKTRHDVAALLGVNRRSLAYQVFRHPKPYISFDIKKRSGGMRTISAPNPSLKKIQRSLSKYLYAVYRTRNPVHGFALERSIATNGDVHLDKRYILKIDLNDFFDTIHIGRVIGLFEKVFHFNKDVATGHPTCPNMLPHRKFAARCADISGALESYLLESRQRPAPTGDDASLFLHAICR